MNSRELSGIKYNSNLPVLAFLASDQIDSVDRMISSGELKTGWDKINQDMITNPKFQHISVLQGTHYIYHSQSEKIYELTKNFLSNLTRK